LNDSKNKETDGTQHFWPLHGWSCKLHFVARHLVQLYKLH